MSYIGENPEENIYPFIEQKSFDSYPESIKKEIKLISFTKDRLATPFGSFIYRIQKYPGDIDLIESFEDCCDVQDVVTKFAKSLKKIVKNMIKQRTHYFSEFKAGLDKRFDIDIGEFKSGIYVPNRNLKNISQDLFYRELLTNEELDIINFILNKVGSVNLNGDDYDIIFNILREHRILRWTSNEILQGYKLLLGGLKKSLINALAEHSDVKIDMISLINGRFIEVTNYLMLAYLDEGEVHPINLDIRLTNYIPIALPREIDKLYFSNMFYSPFKMVKRIFSLSRHNKDQVTLEKIIPFVSSNTSLLYQIKSELDTIILVLEIRKYPPKRSIFKQLDEMKLRLSTVLELSDEELELINGTLDLTNNTKLKYEKIELLKQLKKYIMPIINDETIRYLDKVGLNPPPSYLLPPEVKYNRYIRRSPDDNPINPLKIIEKEMEKSPMSQELNMIDLEPEKRVMFEEIGEEENKKLKELERKRIKKAKEIISEDFGIPIEEVIVEDILELRPDLLHYRPSETKRQLTKKETLLITELIDNQNSLLNLYSTQEEVREALNSGTVNDLLIQIYDENPEVKKYIDKKLKNRVLAAGCDYCH